MNEKNCWICKRTKEEIAEIMKESDEHYDGNVEFRKSTSGGESLGLRICEVCYEFIWVSASQAGFLVKEDIENKPIKIEFDDEEKEEFMETEIEEIK